MTKTWRVRLRSPGLKFRTLCMYRAVSSDSSHHPVLPVCAQIVYIITMKQRSVKVLFQGGGGGRLLATSVDSGLET